MERYENGGGAAITVITAIFSTIVAVCGVFIFFITMHMVIVGWSPAPYWDQWVNLVSGQDITWSWLIKQHNEHRLLIPRIIFLLDFWLAKETNVFDFVVNVLIQAMLAALLAWLALKDAKANLLTKTWVAGLCFTLLFWAGQYENFLWGFQVQFFGVVLLSVAAFATLAMGPVTVLGALATIVVSGAATYTLSSGILVPALALLLGLWLRRPGWYLLILLAGTVGWPATYLWGYETPSVHSDPADFFSHPGAVINHFLIQLGSPFANAMDWTSQLTAAAVAGAVILAAYFGGLIVVFLRPSTPQQKTIAMLSIFLVGWAFLTALGRVRFGPEQALSSSRYLTPLTALWLSILLLWFSATASRPLMRLLTLAIGALIAAGAAASEFRMVDTGLNFALGRKLATPALIAGVDDPILFKLHPRPDVVLEERANLLRFHTSVFAEDWTRLMGEKFADHFRVANNAYCSGSFVQVQAIDVAVPCRSTGSPSR